MTVVCIYCNRYAVNRFDCDTCSSDFQLKRIKCKHWLAFYVRIFENFLFPSREQIERFGLLSQRVTADGSAVWQHFRDGPRAIGLVGIKVTRIILSGAKIKTIETTAARSKFESGLYDNLMAM